MLGTVGGAVSEVPGCVVSFGFRVDTGACEDNSRVSGAALAFFGGAASEVPGCAVSFGFRVDTGACAENSPVSGAALAFFGDARRSASSGNAAAVSPEVGGSWVELGDSPPCSCRSAAENRASTPCLSAAMRDCACDIPSKQKTGAWVGGKAVR